jgi:Domain of unknown function (DUF4111)/Nucleotidyltransferase domain
LVAGLRSVLGADLVAVVLGGSAALGAYEPGRSDLDVLAVTEGELGEPRARRLAAALSHAALPCPARKLELVVLRRAAAAGEPGAPAFDLNLNTGADRADHVGLEPGDEPAHWFVIDRAIARARGRTLYGPAPSDVLLAVPRGDLIAALRASLDWHQAHEADSPDAVLNACRGWRWARTGRWTSKERAGEWARGRMSDPSVVDAALRARGTGERLDADAVAEFLDSMRAAIR